jgi:hypothetical protein
MVMEIAVGAT